jgi:hypothetical protein
MKRTITVEHDGATYVRRNWRRRGAVAFVLHRDATGTFLACAPVKWSEAQLALIRSTGATILAHGVQSTTYH